MYIVTVRNGITAHDIEVQTLAEVSDLEKENLIVINYRWVEE